MTYTGIDTEHVMNWIENDTDFVETAHAKARADHTGNDVAAYLTGLLKHQKNNGAPVTNPDQLHNLNVVSGQVALSHVDWPQVRNSLADMDL